ncbi:MULTISPECIES: carboxymuconolactone decarboxylase family protein [unclassified Spirosoma]|uniref:carboxymuconolactone decarboxylase family protein n=1 Tax=unclassified Spirosoma TaxID=2621999 RepID=UPI00095A549C|nr:MULTISPECIES: carboxymuconolactone decarboxylase family protein [unclassified Spirosoma]MBN8820407.1 carboxymuconolactone decarboxylase family protein [Spirosoma sp.]OJW76092.1 MAG: alkylhydroperoxidase [Spirosoma sp. 48-14]
MKTFDVPTRSQVSAGNQAIFDKLQAGLGFVPNLYATIAYSNNALESYLQLQQAKSSLNKREKEIINLVVSQINGCNYCLAAHTALGKLNGFTNDQILEVRGGSASFSSKYDALARLTQAITQQQGHLHDDSVLDAFYAAGYTDESLVDVIVAIADKIIMNYLHNLTNIPIDFPAAPELAAA